MTLLDRFKDHIIQQHLFSPKDKLLLAVSGGVDSVVLCELCRQAGYDFVIAHCNFQLRGEESEGDEAFVKQLGNTYHVPVFTKAFDTQAYAEKQKLSIQEAARELRYEWFNELLIHPTSNIDHPAFGKPSAGKPPGFILTAHHADDNIETALMNFSRGTGLHGLTGIPASNGHIRRPLLPFFKTELLEFARENSLSFREDSSNQSSKYTRNLFRNEILPLIGTAYPQAKQNLLDNINRFKEIERLYRVSLEEIKKKLCKPKGNEVHIPVKQLMNFNNRALIYEIISGYGFSEKQVDEVIKLAASDSGKYIMAPGGSYQLIKHRHWFIMSPVNEPAAANIIIEEKDKHIVFSGGRIEMEMAAGAGIKADKSNHTAWLDAKEIQFPLLLRKWKAGDYFYPLGMKKKKKLARFFIDQKLSKSDKENAWVIEMNKKIIWVVGQRIDDRFKLSDKTKNALRLQVYH